MWEISSNTFIRICAQALNSSSVSSSVVLLGFLQKHSEVPNAQSLHTASKSSSASASAIWAMLNAHTRNSLLVFSATVLTSLSVKHGHVAGGSAPGGGSPSIVLIILLFSSQPGDRKASNKSAVINSGLYFFIISPIRSKLYIQPRYSGAAL